MSSKSKASYLSPVDQLMARFLQTVSLSVGMVVLLIVGFLFYESGGSEWSSFFDDARWNPLGGEFNLLPMLGASLFTAVGAVVICGPIGLLNGLFLNLYAPKWVVPIFRRCLELLSAIPSVVYGFWGLTFLVPLVDKWFPPGAGLFTATLVLCIMILPTTSLMMDAAFQSVNRKQTWAVRSLGLGEFAIGRMVLLPSTMNTLATSLLLALGRAIGETMAVLMVCGNIIQWPGSMFDPIRTLTANIALELGYAEVEHRTVLFSSGLLLVLFVGILILLSTFFEKRLRHA